ncbi:MAG: cytochrome d ubiquinol oxidase, subunit [Caulobacter sp.]|nr:cytochrome d ubiquinol oxidase, subunit [Caulobacter sp.]
MLDLPLVWSGVIAFAVFMYVLLDGFDLGVGILFPFARERAERDVMMNSIAPIWDGNETWLVLGGGGLLAAFPLAYATLLPALYLPVMVMLFGLIFRGVAFEFRHGTATRVWWWDLAFAGGSVVATFAQGIVLGAFVTGFAYENGRVIGGSFLWLTPFNLTVGVCLLGGYALLGATWLIMRTQGLVQERSYAQAFTLAILVAVGMGLISASTPLTHPEVAARWFAFPNLVLLLPVPIVTVGVWVMLLRSLGNREEKRPFLLSVGLFALGYLGLGVSMWPYLVPRHLTIWDAAAPPTSQGFLLVGVVVLVPIILAYTAYSYWVFRGKVRGAEGYH